eukprot:8461240-Alexandrium_andersonii.AAC.1
MLGLQTPSSPAFVGRFGISTKKRRRTHPSGVSETDVEAVPGPAQFQVRAPEAILHATHGGLRIGAVLEP